MFIFKNKIGAIIHMTVRKLGTEEIVHQTPKFQNIVLNSGLEMMGTQNWGNQCFVGTGSSEPNKTQTTLDNPIAVSSSVLSANDASNKSVKPYYAALVRTYRFNAGVATGNLTEVAIGARTGNGSSTPYKWLCWNRALIKDVNGQPTTLTILADEFLDVTVEIRVYPTEKVTGTFRFLDKLGAVKSTHDFTGYPFIGGVQSYTSKWTPDDLGLYRNVTDDANLQDPSKVMTGSRVAYVSHKETGIVGGTRMESAAVFELTRGNDVPLNGCFVQYSGVFGVSGNLGYKFIFTNPITKTNQEEHTWKAFIEWGHYDGVIT